MIDISLIKALPTHFEVPFIKVRYVAAVLSVIAIIASIGLFMTRGLNYGIDFIGGSVIEYRLEDTGGKSIEQMVAEARDFGGQQNVGAVSVQSIQTNADSPQAIRLAYPRQIPEEGENDDLLQQATLKRVQDALFAEYGGQYIVPDEGQVITDNGNVNILSVSSLGSKVSGELRQKGIYAVVGALFFVLVYIWFRFEWQFGAGAVLALFHDVILTIGVFSLVQIEFNLAIIAAILTIVGYSLNDTVIVYDRIRENLRKYKKMPLGEVLNLSINDTLSRTIMTSVTTVLALLSLYFLGGDALKGFSFAMLWGIFVGTYSSIFVASPLLLALKLPRHSRISEGEAIPSAKKKPAKA